MTPDTSGRLFEMPWAVWDPDSSSWRTYAGTSHSGSKRFSGTWPTSGSMRDGACYEHPTWGHPTNAPASSLLPTPNTMDGMAERSDEALARARTKGGCSNLKDVIPRLLPTPRTSDANGTGDHGTGGPDLRTAIAGDRTDPPSNDGKPSTDPHQLPLSTGD